MGWILEYQGLEYTIEETRHNPFLKGARTYLEGIPRNKCPYSLLHIAARFRWYMGWDEAQAGNVVLKKEDLGWKRRVK